MATTVDECRQIVQAVQETGLTYMMMETVLYSREFLFVKEMYDKGEMERSSFSGRHISRKWERGQAIGKDCRRCTMRLIVSALYWA